MELASYSSFSSTAADRFDAAVDNWEWKPGTLLTSSLSQARWPTFFDVNDAGRSCTGGSTKWACGSGACKRLGQVPATEACIPLRRRVSK
jgi:hypothetical protein